MTRPLRVQGGADTSVTLVTLMAAEPQPAPDEVVSWMRDHALPLVTAEAEQGFADLEPLRELIGDARIVAVGEATHGSREFFQLKHRLLEFLVSEMGFTVFGIEASWPESLAVDDYVVNAYSGDVLDDPNSSTSKGTTMDQWPINYGTNQHWTFVPLADGNYEIVNKASGLVLNEVHRELSESYYYYDDYRHYYRTPEEEHAGKNGSLT